MFPELGTISTSPKTPISPDRSPVPVGGHSQPLPPAAGTPSPQINGLRTAFPDCGLTLSPVWTLSSVRTRTAVCRQMCLQLLELQLHAPGPVGSPCSEVLVACVLHGGRSWTAARCGSEPRPLPGQDSALPNRSGARAASSPEQRSGEWLHLQTGSPSPD